MAWPAEYSLLAAGAPAADGNDQDEDWLTPADWIDADGDDEEVQPPTPIWRISAGAVHRIEADVEQPVLAAAGNRLAGVARLPSDPVIKHIRPGGSLSYGYPGTAIVIDEAGTLRPAGALPGSGGVVCESDRRVWLLGFDDELAEDQQPAVRELLLDEARLADPVDIQVRRPVVVAGGFVVDLQWPREPGTGSSGRLRASRWCAFCRSPAANPGRLSCPASASIIPVRRCGPATARSGSATREPVP